MGTRKTRRTTDRLWLVYLVVAAATVGGYYLVPIHDSGVAPTARVVLYCSVSASSAVAVLYGMARHRPRPWLPWLLLALSQAVNAAGDGSFYVAQYLVKDTSFPALADVLYIGHYPLAVAGLVLLIRRRTPGRDLPSLIDAAVLAVAAGMLSWLYLIAPQTRLAVPLVVKLASLAYPLMDLALLTVALRLILGSGRRPLSFFLLTANLLAMLAADTMYVIQRLAGTYQAGNFLDAIWLFSTIAIGAAALHPTMTRLARRSPVNDQLLGPARMATLSAAALIAPATLLLENARNSLRDVPVIAGACAALSLLTIARLAGLVSDQRRLAITDGLTGLYTRRFFEAQLPLEQARARRADGPLAVFIVDVDRFKSINDRYGHPAGDLVLIEVARRLRMAARAGDVLARYGGEEFVLLAPEVGSDELLGLAERLRHCVADGPIAVNTGIQVVVTVSVGAGCYPLHGDSARELVATADRALYVAKARGRDRVVVGEELPVASGAAADHTATVEYLYHVTSQVDVGLSASE